MKKFHHTFRTPQGLRSAALLTAAAAALATTVGCASLPSPKELDTQAAAMIKVAFRDEGIAKVDRIQQDLAQSACSSDKMPGPETMQKVMQEAMATVKWPANGRYLGDWKEGERLAQGGRGMTWTDKTTDPKANGAQCYNCHQISKEEISHGTLGPSLYNYGKLRGNSEAIVKYTWGKLYNAKAFNSCTNMPRFGQQGILTEAQMKDLMALLLDPNSPVNK